MKIRVSGASGSPGKAVLAELELQGASLEKHFVAGDFNIVSGDVFRELAEKDA
jgi:hypothetical protein